MIHRIGIEIGRISGHNGRRYNHIGIDTNKRVIHDGIRRLGIEFGTAIIYVNGRTMRVVRLAPYYSHATDRASALVASVATVATFIAFMTLVFH